MSEENDGQQAEQTEFKAITSQEELDRLIGARINKVKSQFGDYDDLKAKAEKFDAAEAASKTELEKERERAEAAERKAAEVESRALRLEVGAAKGLTPAQAKRLVGSTKEELEADADELLASFGGTKKKPDPKQLRSGSSSSSDDGLDGKDRAAALLRQYRAASH